MKKLYYIAALAAIGLAGCTSEEEVYTTPAKQEIGFKAVVGKATRAAVTDAFSEGSSIFIASAYQSEPTANYVNHFKPKEFVEFTKSSSFNSPQNEKYYYPSSGKLDFIGYYTGKREVDYVEPEATLVRGGEKDHFTMLKLDYSASGHQLNGETDVMYGNGTTSTFSGSTTLTFQHALAWIVVGINETSSSIRVTNLTLDNVALTGKFSIPVQADHTFGAPVWDVEGMTLSSPFISRYHVDTTDPDYTGVDPSTPGEDATGVLIPIQQQTSLTITYYKADDATKEPITKKLDLDTTSNWEAGKKYYYLINFNVNEIAFTCQTTNWTPDNIDKPIDK